MARIRPLRFTTGSIDALVENFSRSSYQARTLGLAAELWRKKLEEGAIIGVALAGAMTPAGIGGYLAQLIEAGFVDFITSTGANITHDTHFPLGACVTQGTLHEDDHVLRESGIERIYDTLLAPEALTKTSHAVRRFVREITLPTACSSATFHYEFGQFLSRIADRNELPLQTSFLCAAAEYGVPIWTPAFGDSEIGMSAALSALDGVINGGCVSPALCVLELTSLIYSCDRDGEIFLITIGGGSPKNFITQTSPLLIEDIYTPEEANEHPGLGGIIKITTDTPQFGGCSGATPTENITWKKFDPNILQGEEVVVHLDATVAFPILGEYVMNKVPSREPRRLYKKLPAFLDNLREARRKRVAQFGYKPFRHE